MRIATWNVNSIRARLPTVLTVLGDIACDVVCLQEIKCETDAFPYLEIEELGYNCAVYGQKSYNGVALLSKFPLEDVVRGLAGDAADAQARCIEALVLCERPLRVASLYVPNGNPAPGEKYDYKRAWMERLEARAREWLATEEAFLLSGDYNCIPREGDCWDYSVWKDDALGLPQTQADYRRLLNLGLSDAFATHDGRTHQYTFWDYQGSAFAKDHGIRIDHHVLSPQAADRLTGVAIHRAARGLDKPSDHVPVIVELAD